MKKKINKIGTMGLSTLGLGIMSVATAFLSGEMMKMGLFGSNETEKKDLAKGIVDLVCETYQKEIDDLSKENMKLLSDYDMLKEELAELKKKQDSKKK